jgi:PAS domain S-box-containing protein
MGAHTVLTSLEERLQLALDAGAMGTWSQSLETGAEVWDDRQCEIFGVAPGTAMSRELFLSMVHPEDLEIVRVGPEHLVPGARHDSQFRIRRPDGKIRWITARSLARADHNGRVVERIGVNWDSTEHEADELRLLEAERRLALATEAARIGIWDWNVATGEFYYSAIARDIYGFAPDQPITFEVLQQRTHPEDYRHIEPALARALDPALRGRESYRYRITRADNGEERWLLAHGGAAFVDDRPVRYTGTLQDITEEVAIQRKLEDEQARLQLSMSAADLAVWELDVATNRITPSTELNRLYRFAEDARPTTEEFQALYAPGERERVAAEAASIFASGDRTIRFEAKHQWPDGMIKWIAVRAQILVDDQERPTRVIGVALDVTDRRRHEEHLRLTARELQHRVKNSLAIVQSIAAQSFRGNRTKEEGLATFNGRLRALAGATDLLTKGNWSDVAISEIVDDVLGPFDDEHRRRVLATGEALQVPSSTAVNLGMALHELSTNAMKYGALSNETGRLSVTWRSIPAGIELDWQEIDGPVVRPPSRSGFGTSLLTRGLFDEGNGRVELDFDPAGVRCRILIRSASS